MHRSLRYALPALALALPACGGGGSGEERQPSPAEVMSALNQARADLAPHVVEKRERLSPIAPAELEARFRTRPSCRLSRAGSLLLAWAPEAAVARVDGRLARLKRGGAVDPSGGFFEGEGITISVGRLEGFAPAAETSGVARPAGVTIGGGDKADFRKLKAEWTCFW